jgi:hypothetical protein
MLPGWIDEWVGKRMNVAGDSAGTGENHPALKGQLLWTHTWRDIWLWGGLAMVENGGCLAKFRPGTQVGRGGTGKYTSTHVP